MRHRSPRTQLIRKSHHNELNIGHYKRKCKLYYSGVPLKETGSDKLDVYILGGDRVCGIGSCGTNLSDLIGLA